MWDISDGSYSHCLILGIHPEQLGTKSRALPAYSSPSPILLLKDGLQECSSMIGSSSQVHKTELIGSDSLSKVGCSSTLGENGGMTHKINCHPHTFTH